MYNSILPNILFDDLYDEDKFNSLINHCFFISILENSEEDKSLEEKFSDRFIAKPVSKSNQIDKDLELDKLTQINNDYESFTDNFQDDLLVLAIKNIPEYYKYCLKKFMREKGIYSNPSKAEFYKDEKERVLMVVDKTQEAKHLKKKTIDLIVEEAYNCINILDSLRANVEKEYETIPFALKRVELLLLFSTLHDNNIITGLSKSELFERMENYFKYSKKNPLINLYNAYQEYNSGRKNPEKSLQSLKDVLAKTFDII